MGDPLAALQPRVLWQHFAALAAIPRPSKQEQRAVEWVRALAVEHGWHGETDATGNFVARVPASSGRESAPVVVLQSHLDMVCEKNAGTEHDFLRDPIRPRVCGDWVQASGTTLGADNGIGVAAALAAATDERVAHGPLELLFTIDEETGMTGAQGLDPAILHGKTLINLDSEEDGTLFVGCAGGADSQLELDTARAAAPSGWKALDVVVRGLRGGHSGLNIHENRGNAVKLLTRLLLAAADAGIELRLASLSGGDKPNAIPREARATLWIDAAAGPRWQALMDGVRRSAAAELRGVDEGLTVDSRDAGRSPDGLTAADGERLLRLLDVLPHGVLAMSRDIAGLVETSSNVASVRTADSVATIVTSSRSSLTSARDAVLQSISSAGALAGARTRRSDGYPGWKPRMDSPLLKAVEGVFAEIWERAPEVTAVHAGLECGLLLEKVPEMDIVSFGPQIEGAHSPDERVNTASVQRFWRALARTLDVLSAG